MIFLRTRSEPVPIRYSEIDEESSTEYRDRRRIKRNAMFLFFNFEIKIIFILFVINPDEPFFGLSCAF